MPVPVPVPVPEPEPDMDDGRDTDIEVLEDAWVSGVLDLYTFVSNMRGRADAERLPKVAKNRHLSDVVRKENAPPCGKTIPLGATPAIG